MLASDASVQIRRDPDEVMFSGSFGYDATAVGDTSGNGHQEFIARLGAGPDSVELKEHGKDLKEYYQAFLLIEPPPDGIWLPEEVTTARWTTDKQGWAFSEVQEHPVIGGHDLDGDGHPDYLFAIETIYGLLDDPEELGYRESRLDLWYGPTEPLMNLDDGAQTLDPPTDRWNARLSFGAIHLLEEPGAGGDWTLAASVGTAHELGVATPTVVLVTAEEFASAEVLDDVPTVWSTGEQDIESGSLLEVADLDGDGIHDLAVASRTNEQDDTIPMRIWALYGPDFDGRSVLDADVTILGETGDHPDLRFVHLPQMDHADGPVVAAWLDTAEELGWYFFTLPATGTVTADDAFAAIVEDDDYAPYDTLAWCDDLDADGAPELALRVSGGAVNASGVVLMDVPDGGVVPVSDHHVRIESDPNPWIDDPSQTDLGTTITADVDWNGDGFSDLLLGEPFWDDFVGKDICCYRYGRIGIFHGGPGGY